MALNGGSLNSHALNAAARFVSDTGSATINIEQIVGDLGTTTINVEQLVGAQGTGTVNVVQVVEGHWEGTGTANIVQIVNSTGNPIINIEQTVVNAAAVDFHSRNGYEPRLYIDGSRIDDDQIHGQMVVIFRENEAPQLQFTLIPDTGTQDIRSYRGKSVFLSIREDSTITRIFTGTINNPDVMIIDQKIRFNCSLDIDKEVQDNVGQDFIDSVGFYDASIFNKPKTKMEELRDRLTTVPQAMCFDNYGKLNIYNIAPKATQDYTLTDSQVYRDSLDYVFSSQQRYLNKITIKANFTYQRLHHRQLSFSASSGTGGFCEFISQYLTPLRRDLVRNAANGAGWPVKSMSFTPFYSSGYYNCGAGPIGFLTTKCNTVNEVVKDDDGNAVTINGETQYSSTAQSCVDTASNLCLGASWQASTHFAQNIRRSYTLTVEAPQSIASYGEKVKEEDYALVDEYTAQEWENYSEHSETAPDGFSITGSSGNNFYVDAITNSANFDRAANVMLNRAKAEILKSHRDDKVMFKRSLWTAISLGDTVRLNTGRVVCKGKVLNYEHVIDLGSGEAYTKIELVFSRSEGSATDSTLALPSIDMSTVAPVWTQTAVRFGATYGTSVNDVENPSGFYGNRFNSDSGTFTQHPVTYVVAIPPIPDANRKEAIPTATGSFDVEIPNDELTINFTDTNYQ